MIHNLIRVLIADDTVTAREGWKAILETAADIKVVDEAQTPIEATQKALELVPDILLMDLKWFGDRTAGCTAIKNIKASRPEVKIIAVTAYDELLHEARAAGADAALAKDFSRGELLELIQGLASGRIVPSQILIHSAPKDLTSREIEILALLALGESDKDIADKLVISQSTVKNHVQSILEKLDAKNRTDAAHLARQLGLIS